MYGIILIIGMAVVILAYWTSYSVKKVPRVGMKNPNPFNRMGSRKPLPQYDSHEETQYDIAYEHFIRDGSREWYDKMLEWAERAWKAEHPGRDSLWYEAENSVLSDLDSAIAQYDNARTEAEKREAREKVRRIADSPDYLDAVYTATKPR